MNCPPRFKSWMSAAETRQYWRMFKDQIVSHCKLPGKLRKLPECAGGNQLALCKEPTYFNLVPPAPGHPFQTFVSMFLKMLLQIVYHIAPGIDEITNLVNVACYRHLTSIQMLTNQMRSCRMQLVMCICLLIYFAISFLLVNHTCTYFTLTAIAGTCLHKYFHYIMQHVCARPFVVCLIFSSCTLQDIHFRSFVWIFEDSLRIVNHSAPNNFNIL